MGELYGPEDLASYSVDFSRWLDESLADPLFVPVSPLVTSEAKERITRFVTRLVEVNRGLNLTAITEARDVAVKHVADSLTCLLVAQWPTGARVCDVGTGGGFPGMVIAIVRPDLAVHLIDAVGKKLAFLSSVAQELGLRATTWHGRAEELGRDRRLRESHDVVVARAVARLSVLAEYCLPLCKVGGWFVAMKGPGVVEELEEGRRALHVLGGRVDSVREIELPCEAGKRTLIIVRKERATPPAYPRRPGIPAKRPLV